MSTFPSKAPSGSAASTTYRRTPRFKKGRARLLVAAIALLTPFNADRAPFLTFDGVAQEADEASRDDASRFDYYVGADARWLVDRRDNVVSAWSLQEDRPLWSRDGVVFRENKRPTDVIASFKKISAEPKPATEIFGRVYFFLNLQAPQNDERNVRRNELLVALDPRAQGRLVWKLRAPDFAFLFSPDVSSLQFLDAIAPLPNDRLLIVVQGDGETRSIEIDAATGALCSLP